MFPRVTIFFNQNARQGLMLLVMMLIETFEFFLSVFAVKLVANKAAENM